MKEQSSIPISKVQRATKFVKTGAKVGGNYVKYYSKKILNPELDKTELNNDNAEDIYQSLSELKGSALKVAQMLSMDKNLLPSAYQDKFSMSQYSAPPLSYPLVIKTFKKYFDKSPLDIFDTFTQKAVNAASIGQVHKATKGNKSFAVKIQYPGVADSITSDLKLVKPIALRMFNLSEVELNQYMGEVESKLKEETDYELELQRSVEIGEDCQHIPNLFFPKYYPDYSAARIITMDWIEGLHLKEFLKTNPSQAIRNQIGQALWDFYDHQIHNLKKVHADPHPGNFLMREEGTVGIIDFGCVKVIPEDFYQGFFKLMSKDLIINDDEMIPILYELNFIYKDEPQKDKDFFMNIFKEMTELVGRPFHGDTFDFADDEYFNTIYAMSDRLSKMKEFRNSKHARGSKHGLYINRTYFGLYSILNELRAFINITKPEWLKSSGLETVEV